MMKKKILGYIKITRPINLLIILFAVFMGYILINNTIVFSDLIFFVPIIFIAAAGYILNDIIDLEEDTVNRPNRVLVKKIFSKKAAYIYLSIFFIISIIISIFNLKLIIPTILLIIGVIIYDKYLKSTPIIGNILTSILSSFPVIWGGIIADGFYKLLWIVALAFFLHLSREIVKDISDIKGDNKAQKKTTALVLGEKLSTKISLIFYLISTLLIISLRFCYNFSIYYFILSIITVLSSLIISLIFLLKNKYKKASEFLRVAMFFQVLIIIMERLVFSKILLK